MHCEEDESLQQWLTGLKKHLKPRGWTHVGLVM